MTGYSVTMQGPSSNPAQQDTDIPDAAEDAEAAHAFDAWLTWLDAARAGIVEAGGDYNDADSLLATILEHLTVEAVEAAAAAEQRASKFARDTLLEVRDSNRLIARISRTQREAREKQAADAKTLAKRLAGVDAALAAAKQENVELRTKLAEIERNLTKATDLLTREIAKERSLRRLLDAQRSRPHVQRVASELAKRHAQKALEAATKAKTEATVQ